MSKNRTEAREAWLKRQEKLQKGVLDEDTLSVLETCSKKPPEKNHKNITYFIRAEQSELRSEASKCEVSNSTISLPAVKEEDCVLINKIDRDLKETRDFIQKFDKFNHVTKTDVDPAKMLTVHQTIKAKNYETNAEQVVRRSMSKDKNAMKKSGAKSSENQNSISMKRSAEKAPETKEEDDELENSFEKLKKIANKDDDIACYFSSLNKIEDTIKFLEQNIIGAEQKQKENKKEEPTLKDSLGQKENAVTRKPFEPIDINKFFEGSPVRNEPPRSSEKKPEAVMGLLSDGKPHFDLENFEPSVKGGNAFGAENHPAADNFDDEQISFSLTMRSGDFDQENENRRPTERDSVTRPSVQNELGLRTENYFNYQNPRNEFESLTFTKEQPKMTKQQNSSKIFEEPENENKENEFCYDENEEIERIKQMLKATQEDIQKMTSVVFEFPGQTVKRPTSLFSEMEAPVNKVNTVPYSEPLRGLVSMPSHNTSYANTSYAESTLERNPLKGPSLTVKPEALASLLRNAEKMPLQDVTNQYSVVEEEEDEEVPKPVTIRTKPIPMAHPKNERNSLSIRANLR